MALAHDSSSSVSTPSALRRCVQNEARRSFGGVATDAWRLNTLFTSCVHPLDECPRSQSVASGNKYGLGGSSSSCTLASYAATHCPMPGGRVWIVGP